jgi:hypothetical protein
VQALNDAEPLEGGRLQLGIEAVTNSHGVVTFAQPVPQAPFEPNCYVNGQG